MHVILMAALTADGFIGKDASHLSTRWTSKEDSRFFSEVSTKAGVIIIGSNTYKTFTRKLEGRKMIVYSRSTGENPYGNDVVFTQDEPRELLRKLGEEGHTEVVIAGGASVYTLFMTAGVVDTLLLTKEPVVFGTGVTLFSSEVSTKIELVKIHDLSSQTKVFEYVVDNTKSTN